MYGGNASSGPIYLVRNGALAVPSDYVGLHFRAWPLFNAAYWAASSQPFPTSAAPAPTGVGFGTWRSHDSGYAQWMQIETSAGVYTWSNLDTLITTHRTAGRTVMFTPTGVPTFYLSAGNPARGTASQNSVYPDGTLPNGLTGWINFVTALITRYNATGGAWRVANPTLGKGIQIFELWNEPAFGGIGAGGFWDSSASLLVDLSVAARTAAKGVDSAIQITSPGFIASNTMQTFLQADGVSNPTTTGLSLCDAIDIHFYQIMPPALGLGTFNNEIIEANQSLQAVIAICGASGLPLECTESGFDFTAGTAGLTLIAAQTPQWRYNWWARILMVGAALGYQKWIGYTWDTPYLNYPDSDPTGTAQAINDVHVNVAGKTIKNAFYFVGDTVTLQFTDGSSFTV